MRELSLNDTQVEVLREILGQSEHQLLLEIANADSRSFRDELRRRETIVRDLMAALEEGEPVQADRVV
ncbi:MAG TPA: hypothetical protein VFQ38_06880 [Longimicrobiales bacterium]|nr:hypothetical protein [Longimicrobiales bacterium]